MNELWASSSRKLLAAWWLLAIFALGVSSLFAVILVVARTPFLGLGGEVFRTALVLHVDLAVVVWFLTAAAGVWTLAAPVTCCVMLRFSRWGFALSAIGIFAILLAPLFGSPAPVLANYVPVLDSQLFFVGLLVFLAGIGMAALAALASFVSQLSVSKAEKEGLALWRWSSAAAVFVFWVAIIVFLLAQQATDIPFSVDVRLWGGGHVLQIVHTLMLMAAWLYLGADALRRVAVPRSFLLLLIVIETLTSLAELAVALSFPLDSLAYRRGFTEVMRWATWPAPLALAAVLMTGYYRTHCTVGLKRIDGCILFSIALFMLGCIVGATIRGETTAIPAHYHGTVGAVTLAYMAWGGYVLKYFNLTVTNASIWRWQPFVYGLGIGLMVIGLAWAGWLGVPRKSPHAEAMALDGGYQVAMSIAGIGGLLAIAGAAIFVIVILNAVRKQRSI
jgi:cytochrome c oxidase subunit 1